MASYPAVVWLVMVAVLTAYGGLAAAVGLRLLRARATPANVITAFWAALIPVVALELYLQYAWVGSDSYGWVSRNFALRYYRADPFGLRDSGLPLSQRAPNLVVLGDSIAFGAGLRDPDQRYGNLLRRALPEHHVVVMAENGGGPRVETEMLEHFADPRASTRAVIHNYAMNDILDATPAGFVAKPRGREVWKPYFERVELVRHVYCRLIVSERSYDRYAVERFERAYADPEIFARHREELRILAGVVERRYRAPLVFVLWPNLDTVSATPGYRRVLALARELGAEVVDLLPTFAGHASEELVVGPRDRHPNEYANRLVSERVLGVLARLDGGRGRAGDRQPAHPARGPSSSSSRSPER